MKPDSLESDDLLALLDAAVTADQGLAGFEGVICVGIQDRGRATWWRAAFGRLPDTRFVRTQPRTADVMVLMGRSEAESIIRHQRLPEKIENLYMRGDEVLWNRFVSRYVDHLDPIALRIRVGHDPI